MSAADLSGDRIADRLGALEDGWASFPVNQTTLSVSPDAYERARRRCESGLADVYVQIYDEEDDVLLVEGDDGWVVPHAQPDPDVSLERGTCRALAEQTGVQCELTALERATILGVRNDADSDVEPVYRLVAVFGADRVGGSPAPGAAWHSDVSGAEPPTY